MLPTIALVNDIGGLDVEKTTSNSLSKRKKQREHWVVGCLTLPFKLIYDLDASLIATSPTSWIATGVDQLSHSVSVLDEGDRITSAS